MEQGNFSAEQGNFSAEQVSVADDGVVLVGLDRLAEMVMDTGLFGWLLKKVG